MNSQLPLSSRRLRCTVQIKRQLRTKLKKKSSAEPPPNSKPTMLSKSRAKVMIKIKTVSNKSNHKEEAINSMSKVMVKKMRRSIQKHCLREEDTPVEPLLSLRWIWRM